MAYIEGWVGVKTSDQLDAVHAFMDFHLQPKQYADFVNSTGTAYLMPDASPFVKKEISENPILAFDDELFDRVTFEAFKGESLGAWTKAWMSSASGSTTRIMGLWLCTKRCSRAAQPSATGTLSCTVMPPPPEGGCTASISTDP